MGGVHRSGGWWVCVSDDMPASSDEQAGENSAKRKREDDEAVEEAEAPEAPEVAVVVEIPQQEDDGPPVRQLITDDTETETYISTLNVELTCPVCLGLIRNAMTVMECVHRFCEACITKCLRLGKKECPSCRMKCVSRRSLRRDPNFDAVVRKIYPRLEEYEAEQDALIEADNQVNASVRHEQRASIHKNAAKKIQVQLQKKQQLTRRGGGVGGRAAVRDRVASNAGNAAKAPTPARPLKRPQRRDLQPIMESDVEFGFTLRRHPLEDQLQCLVKEYLKTSRMLSVNHLQKFLSMKLQWQSHNTIQLTYCTSVDNGVTPEPLDPGLTLEAVFKELAAFRNHPILYYYCSTSPQQWALPQSYAAKALR